MNEHFSKLLKRFNNRLLFIVGKTQNTKIIGNNHKLYLLVLRFIHYFSMISHENILLVGCNKVLIDDLNQINACNTYYVKTNGVTLRNCTCIEKAFFSNEKIYKNRMTIRKTKKERK